MEEDVGIQSGKLRGIFGGSLEQIAVSLKHLPLSVVSRARPSHDAHAMLRSKGFADLPAPPLSSLYFQPHAAWSDTTLGTAGVGALNLTGLAEKESAAIPPVTSKQSVSEGQGQMEEKWFGDYAEMTAAVEERMGLLSRLHTDNFLKAEAEREWEEEKLVFPQIFFKMMHGSHEF